MSCPRLIETALPIREISAESVRDKNIHHAHISHLHLWWARRPLAASRAVVFASLVPDPDHPDCPEEFREAVQRLLKDDLPYILQGYQRGKRVVKDRDPYKPYENIEDTPRNRLLTFIAKWSPEWQQFERGEIKQQPKPGEMLDDRSLIKWETSDPEKLQGQAVLKIARELVKIANNGKTPILLDPFAGGGSIPLEAGRLGCQAIANDYNPVAYLILRATCEFPQKYGKPGVRKRESGEEIKVNNVLAYDVEYWAKWILDKAREKIGHLYPPGKNGNPVVGYLWARTAPCSNPACGGEIPLLRSLLVCNTKGKRVALTMKVDKTARTIEFGITKDGQIKQTEGTMLNRGNCKCPYCEQVTSVKDVRQAGLEGKMGERMVTVIIDTKKEKDYRPVEEVDLEAFEKASNLAKKIERPSELILPEITLANNSDISNSTGIRVHLYGMKTWGSLFNTRQLLAMQTLLNNLNLAHSKINQERPDTNYNKGLLIYLALWLDRVAVFNNNVTRWRSSHQKSETPFGGQAIPMIWDYPEVNPLADTSGSASTQLKYVVDVIRHESLLNSDFNSFSQILLSDGENLNIIENAADIVVTDPPYFDAISYADLSDFFYIWLKRSLGNIFPELFSTPLTPKVEEATALKHRHSGIKDRAEKHFFSKIALCLKEAKRVCKKESLLSIMFAHQSTEAWTALINALFEAGLTTTATYPIETEMKSTALALGTASLESSITVVCRSRQVGNAVSYLEVRKEIEKVVEESVHRFWNYGFRGADLIVACYGPAVGVFGKYERVERADGSTVEVPELLELAKSAALKAIAGEFSGDALSRLYFVWANLYGSGQQTWDDARLVVQMGGDSESALEVARQHHLFVVNGSECRLALLRDRVEMRKLGEEANSSLIDQLHKAMQLWKTEQRKVLVQYLAEHQLMDHTPFWKLAQALFEVLPRDEEDWKLVSALLGERETLRLEIRRGTVIPKTLFDE